MRYCVVKGTTTVIDGSLNADDVMLQNAEKEGFTVKQIEILTPEQYEERKSLEPQPPKEYTEIEKLRLEQARANSELVQLIMMMGGA